MKLSSFMEKQFKLMDDELLLEASDKTLDKNSSTDIFIISENTVMSRIKKITTVAACFMLAIAAVITFVMIRNSIETVPEDSAADKAETNENVEDYNYEVPISYETREEYGYIRSRFFPYAAVWNDFIFYENHNDILYKNVSAGPYTATSIFGDKENNDAIPDQFVHFRHIAVDHYASERNDGWPVLIIVYETTIEDENGYPTSSGAKIISYDMKTKKSTLLADNICELIQSFGIYGEYIFVSAAASDATTDNNIYRIALDGSETIMLDNPDGAYNTLENVDDEYVYYFQDPNTIYRTTHDFEEKTEVYKSSNGIGVFGHGDHLYTLGGRKAIHIDGETFWSVDLWKMDRDNTTEHEVLIEGINNVFQSNNMLYYLKVEPTYYGGKLCKLKNVIYSYYLNTGEETIVADLTNIEKEITIIASSEQSLLLQMKEYKPGVWTEYKDGVLTEYGENEMTDWDVYHYSLESGELTEVISYYKTESHGWLTE